MEAVILEKRYNENAAALTWEIVDDKEDIGKFELLYNEEIIAYGEEKNWSFVVGGPRNDGFIARRGSHFGSCRDCDGLGFKRAGILYCYCES